MDLNLDRIQQALLSMGGPCRTIPAIQVAGTNGKGSICSFIDSGLQAAGISRGLTTSPHLVSWCERIRTNGVLISSAELRRRLIKLSPLVRRHHLTPFEQLMAAALGHFEEQKVELLILEVGLGGRLDATTAHPHRPVVAFGQIGLDHCEHLGNTLRKIALEKTAVIGPGATVISSAQHPEVSAVLEEATTAQGASIQWVKPLPEDVILGLPGQIQRENAAVAQAALEALRSLGWHIPPDQIRNGLASAAWPARLQTMLWNSHHIVLDGAHNPLAAHQLAKERLTWQEPTQKIHWILGIQANKDAPAMLEELLQPNDLAWIVPISNHSSWSSIKLQEALPDRAAQIIGAKSVDDVLAHLNNQDVWPSPSPIIAGSLYLLGDLLHRKIFTAE